MQSQFELTKKVYKQIKLQKKNQKKNRSTLQETKEIKLPAYKKFNLRTFYNNEIKFLT